MHIVFKKTKGNDLGVGAHKIIIPYRKIKPKSLDFLTKNNGFIPLYIVVYYKKLKISINKSIKYYISRVSFIFVEKTRVILIW